MAVDDVIGIQIHGRYQMQNIVNVIHYQITEQVADDHDVLNSLCQGWESQNKVNWLARHLDSYRLMGLKGFSLTGNNKRPGIVHIDEAGSVVGTEEPSPVCRVITLYTDSSNYRRRGRVQLSGGDTTMFNDADGAVSDTELGFMAILGAALIADISNFGDVGDPGLAPSGVLPFEPYTDVLARRTPSLIRSRRIRGFSIG